MPKLCYSRWFTYQLVQSTTLTNPATKIRPHLIVIFEDPVNTYRPSHSRILGSIKLILLPVCNILEIVHSCIVEILTGKDNIVEVSRMDISNWMLIDVPSTKAQIETTHKSDFAIDEAKFFVMCPV